MSRPFEMRVAAGIPIRCARPRLAVAAGADGITAHLREDRRHIRDEDIARLKAEIDKPLNFEMAATDDMIAIALRTGPHAACLVPERRAERTTEGGLDVAGQRSHDRRMRSGDWAMPASACRCSSRRIALRSKPQRRSARR